MVTKKKRLKLLHTSNPLIKKEAFLSKMASLKIVNFGVKMSSDVWQN